MLFMDAVGISVRVHHWRERNREVDFVLRRGDRLAAIEVASGAWRTTLPGMSRFAEAYSVQRTLLVGSGGLPLAEFFRTSPSALLD
ncbi:MAG: hypothetical protein ACETWG_02455 [Candidatus Neomarinimicrobiota bacterium]